MEKKCENCKYSKEQNPIFDQLAPLDCKINPPIILTNDHSGKGIFPSVKRDDWCGKFEEKQP